MKESKKDMTTVNYELIRRIRLHIDRIEKQALLRLNQEKWLQLMSALDVLEDTSYAVEYYLESDYPDDIKGKYLFTYGVLQSLFVQQDAVNSIHYALFDTQVDFHKDYPAAYQVREMRNEVVGHPTNRDRKCGGKEFIHLAQVSLKKTGFYYSKSASDAETGRGEIINVSVSQAIEDVSSIINSVLEIIVAALDKEFQEYIDKHRERKMKEIFKELQYAKEKVLSNSPLADLGYSITKEMVSRCEEELISRYGSIEATDSYKYLLNDIRELYDLIDNGLLIMPIEIWSLSERYFTECLFSKLETLQMYAAETDQYFETRSHN